jgi:membrane fusion protein (multidrug efflux system)
MQFLRRSLMGLMLLAATLGMLALAGNTFYAALQERLGQETFKRPVRERAVAVNTVVVSPQRVTPVITAFGSVESRRTLDIRASVGGRIVTLAEGFEDGAQVISGTLLVRVDPTDAVSAVDVAQTDLLEAEAELRDAQRGLVLARDELLAAQAQDALREQALERQRNLLTRGVGTEAAVETAALAEASAGQAVLSSRQAEAQAESRIDQAHNRLRRQQIALARIERDLADTEIRAAFTGTLAEVSIVEGGLVTPNERLAQLIDPASLEVAFRLSTAQYARLLDANGALMPAPVVVSLDVLGLDLEATGTLSRVSASVGEGTTGRQIFARLETFAGFRPGDFVTVTVQEPYLDQVARVPATAVDSAGQVLLIDENSRLVTAQVDILRRQADDVIIHAPELTGRQIVSELSPVIGEGILVKVIGPEPADGPADGPDDGDAVTQAPAAPEKITLTNERRARLIAFVEANRRMPAEAKQRVLAQLKEDEVSSSVVARIEGRMGG